MLVMQIMRSEVAPLNESHFGEDFVELVGAMMADAWNRADAVTLLSWDNVSKKFEMLEPELKKLAAVAEADAQSVAKEWTLRNDISSARKHVDGSAAHAPSDAEFTNVQMDGATRPKNNTSVHLQRHADAKVLLSHRRVWRFGSGQHAPKLVEELLARDIKVVSLGGFDTTGAAPLSENERRQQESAARHVPYEQSDEEFEAEFGDGGFNDGVFSSFAFAACEEGEVLTWGATAWVRFTSRLPRSQRQWSFLRVLHGFFYCCGRLG